MDLIKDLTSFISKAHKPLIVILGATASGKTALSLKIAHAHAHEIEAEIISTDSCQIYKGMEIATDAILPEQMEGIEHHLINFAEPDQTITLAEYKDMASEAIKKIHSKKHVPIIVGGTGLYISAIIEDYQVPRIPPDQELRKKLQKEAEEKGAEHLHRKLAKLDPQSAAKIHPNNLRYVIRALEINLSGKQKKQDKKAQKSPYNIFMLGIEWPREELYKRIELRVDLQLKRGLIDEVKNLLKKYDADLPSMSSLGVKEIIPYIKGEKSLEECTEILKKNTRHYAKRQMTWFRRYKDVKWISNIELEKILKN